MPVLNSINDLKDQIAEWRHALHENPQTSYEEVFASNLVQEKLTEWGIPFKSGIAVTGVVATIEGQKNTSGKKIALRADMDALDIIEEEGIPYATKNQGKMHAFGHEGHTATLLGTAKYLNDNRNFDGTVYLIFQPAEEGGRGAHKMIEEGLFKDFDADYVFGYHNDPYIDYGLVEMRDGPFMAAVDELEIKITGKGGHAAWPHDTNDTVVTSAHLITALQTIVSRGIDPVEAAVVSITNVNTGEGATNVIYEETTITGTVRTFCPEVRKHIEKRINEISDGIAATFGNEISVDYEYGLDATINTTDGVEMAAKAARKVLGDNNVNTECEPVMGGEDFGAYLFEKPGAFFFVGQRVKDDPDSRHNQGLHTPRYNFNDDIAPIAASTFAAIVEDYMPLND
jgi:hippurate hydrolase